MCLRFRGVRSLNSGEIREMLPEKAIKAVQKNHFFFGCLRQRHRQPVAQEVTVGIAQGGSHIDRIDCFCRGNSDLVCAQHLDEIDKTGLHGRRPHVF